MILSALGLGARGVSVPPVVVVAAGEGSAGGWGVETWETGCSDGVEGWLGWGGIGMLAVGFPVRVFGGY